LLLPDHNEIKGYKHSLDIDHFVVVGVEIRLDKLAKRWKKTPSETVEILSETNIRFRTFSTWFSGSRLAGYIGVISSGPIRNPSIYKVKGEDVKKFELQIKQEIMGFNNGLEQKHLGIDHKLNSDEVSELDSIKREEPIMSFQDKESPYYAKELDIAVQAHQAIFINGEGNQRQSVTNRLKTWLQKHYPDQSNAFYERVSTVVNPKK